MTAGVETYVENTSIAQITTDGIYFSLKEKVSIPQTGWTTVASSNQQYYDYIADGVTLFETAIAVSSNGSAVWAEFLRDFDETNRIRIHRVGNNPVNLYLFVIDSAAPNSSNSGLEIYSGGAENRIIFGSDKPVLMPMGFITHDGYSGASLTGKSIAIVPVKMGAAMFLRNESVYGDCMYAGALGWMTYREESWARTAILINSAGVSLQNRTFNAGPYPTGCSPFSTGNYVTSTNSFQFSAMVIDVTNI